MREANRESEVLGGKIRTLSVCALGLEGGRRALARPEATPCSLTDMAAVTLSVLQALWEKRRLYLKPDFNIHPSFFSHLEDQWCAAARW